MNSVSKISLVIMVLAAWTAPSSLRAPASTPLSKADAKAYSAALQAAAKGNWKTANRRTARISGDLPKKLLRWMELSSRGTRRTFFDISNFVLQNPDWPRRGTLRRRAEEALDQRVSNAEALSWFKAYPPLTSDGHIHLVEAVVANGPTDRPRKLVHETWTKINFGRKQEGQFLRTYRKYLSTSDHRARLNRLLWDGQIFRAQRVIRLVDKDTQKLAMARIALRAKRGGVDWHIRRVPKSMHNDPGLIFERARWRRRKGRDNDAYDLLKAVPPGTPNAPKWSVERSIIARRLLAKGHISEAYRLAKANGLSTGARFVEAEWLAGWIALRHLNEPKAARTHFDPIDARVS